MDDKKMIEDRVEKIEEKDGFRSFQHVERIGLGKNEIGFFECDDVYIMPKMDGTNASIWRDPNTGQICYGSRSRKLTLDRDNRSFMLHMSQYERHFHIFFDSFPNWRLYGEWLVPHTIKNYDSDAWNKFFVFDVHDGTQYLSFRNYQNPLLSLLAPWIEKLEVVPATPVAPEHRTALRCIDSDEALDAWLDSTAHSSLACWRGSGKGEGIVVKSPSWRNKYGRQQWYKIVRHDFKNSKYQKPPMGDVPAIESVIFNKYVTDAWLDKELAKRNYPLSEKSSASRYMNELWDELVKEEMGNIVAEFWRVSKRKLVIEFSVLRRLLDEAVRNKLFN